MFAGFEKQYPAALKQFYKSAVAEWINLPFEEKTAILYKNKKQA